MSTPAERGVVAELAELREKVRELAGEDEPADETTPAEPPAAPAEPAPVVPAPAPPAAKRKPFDPFTGWADLTTPEWRP